MQIDSRITTGLAWAGALLVVAIPTADFFMRQNDAPAQMSVVQEEISDNVTLPTTSAERPAAPAPASEPAPVQTAAAPTKPQSTGDKIIDSYLESGRELPSYISDGGTTKPAAETPKPQPVQPVTTSPAAPATTPAATPAPVETAALPRTKLVTLPTPVSQRPPSVAVAPVITEPAPVVAQQPAVSPQQPVIVTPSAQPPLIISEPDQIITAEDLEDWETGPLSDFLARRTGGGQSTQQFDGNGFFLDEAPGNLRPQRMPDAYDDEYYFPFGQ
ncbi:MAG: hypothetical protein GX970_17405 [Phyllobacteriaceae bacterium]|nr:hypothetical protein [Phyllobacteriaceae bacterium]